MTTPILRMHNLAEGICECQAPLLHKKPCDHYVQHDEPRCTFCGHGLACHVAKQLEEVRRRNPNV